MEKILKNLPADYLERIGYLSILEVSDSNIQSVDFIRNEFTEITTLYQIIKFVNDVWFETCIGFSSFIKKVGYIPLNQAKNDFHTSLEQLLISNYRSAYDSLRRMFEMAILQIYFSLNEISQHDAEKWKRSEMDTPNFTKMVKAICKSDKFLQFNKDFNLEDNNVITDLKLPENTEIKFPLFV